MAEQNSKTSSESKDDNPIRRLTLGFIMAAAIFFIWYVLSDRYTPFTSEARVRGYVVPIAAEVSGPVVEIAAKDNQLVEAGDVLLQLDKTPFQLAVKKAEAELEDIGQALGAGLASVAAAETQLANAQTERAYVLRQSDRVLKLEAKGVISEIEADKVRTAIEKSELNVANATARLQEEKTKVGIEGDENPRMRKALAGLSEAQLNLNRTTVRAPSKGGATNFAIDVGHYAAAGQPLMTFISTNGAWIEAYMRENMLGNIKVGNEVELVLDVAPGRVFKGRVASTGYGVDWGQTNNPGLLPTISTTRGWLRDPQRFPVNIEFANEDTKGLKRVGGQVDVVIYTSGNWVMNSIAWVSIRLTSLVSYLH